MFDHDWFFGIAYAEQQDRAVERLVTREFKEVAVEALETDPAVKKFVDSVECRTLLYLRDGFSYEVKELVENVTSKSQLTIECEPSEDLYKVGVFLIAVPFDEIARVEVFAVHTDKRPENLPMITGFKNSPHRAVETVETGSSS